MDHRNEFDGPGAVPWREESRKRLLPTSIFTVSRALRRSESGKRGEFLLVDAPDWVTVIPVLEEKGGTRTFVMVRQYRHGCGCVTLEFPGGLVDEGEDPAGAAARELREETGFEPHRLIAIGSTNPNPSFMTNRCHFFLAEDVAKAGAPSLDPLEEIEVVQVAEADLWNGSEHAKQFGQHAIMLAAAAAYQKSRSDPGLTGR